MSNGILGKKEGNLAICDNMSDLEGVILNEINQIEKDDGMISLIQGI